MRRRSICKDRGASLFEDGFKYSTFCAADKTDIAINYSHEVIVKARPQAAITG